MTTPEPDIFGDYQVRVFKNPTRTDPFAIGLGVVVGVLSFVLDGAGAEVPPLLPPRWLVVVRSFSDDRGRVVACGTTLRGARRKLRRVSEVLASGDSDRIGKLPDIDMTDSDFGF